MYVARLVIATIAAPFAAAVTTIILQLASGGNIWPYNISDLAWIFGFSTALGFIALIGVGLPIVYILLNSQRMNLITLTVAGAAAGVAVVGLLLLFLDVQLDSNWAFVFLPVIYGGPIGAAVAFCFGIIAGIQNLKYLMGAA